MFPTYFLPPLCFTFSIPSFSLPHVSLSAHHALPTSRMGDAEILSHPTSIESRQNQTVEKAK